MKPTQTRNFCANSHPEYPENRARRARGDLRFLHQTAETSRALIQSRSFSGADARAFVATGARVADFSIVSVFSVRSLPDIQLHPA
jgi:hypothetical protein